MPFPIDVTRCLAFSNTHTPLRVCTIPFDGLRAKLGARGLHEGEEVVVELVTDGNVIVVTRDGRRTLVERQYAVMVEVETRSAASLTPPSTSRTVRLRSSNAGM